MRDDATRKIIGRTFHVLIRYKSIRDQPTDFLSKLKLKILIWKVINFLVNHPIATSMNHHLLPLFISVRQLESFYIYNFSNIHHTVINIKPFILTKISMFKEDPGLFSSHPAFAEGRRLVISNADVSMTGFPLRPCSSLSSWIVSSLLSRVGRLSMVMMRGGAVSTACQELGRDLDIGPVIWYCVLVIICVFEERKSLWRGDLY